MHNPPKGIIRQPIHPSPSPTQRKRIHPTPTPTPTLTPSPSLSSIYPSIHATKTGRGKNLYLSFFRSFFLISIRHSTTTTKSLFGSRMRRYIQICTICTNCVLITHSTHPCHAIHSVHPSQPAVSPETTNLHPSWHIHSAISRYYLSISINVTWPSPAKPSPKWPFH